MGVFLYSGAIVATLAGVTLICAKPDGSTGLERFNTGLDLLDITPEKCEHSNLLGSETHT